MQPFPIYVWKMYPYTCFVFPFIESLKYFGYFIAMGKKVRFEWNCLEYIHTCENGSSSQECTNCIFIAWKVFSNGGIICIYCQTVKAYYARLLLVFRFMTEHHTVNLV